ncbi:Alpha/Beta hydrolase protein [Mycena olivaceomarginata]|nr:Alpha/Beta hydrolase protein [Mycena olivaceomarginata]
MSPPQLRAKWGLQIAEGIAFVHSHQIVWGDCSTANMLLTADLDILLCDFGGSALYGGRTNVLPPLCYCDPTIPYEDNLYNGKKVDIFGFGCVFLEILTYNPDVTMTSEPELHRGGNGIQGRSLNSQGLLIDDVFFSPFKAIVENCWDGKYADGQQLFAAVCDACRSEAVARLVDLWSALVITSNHHARRSDTNKMFSAVAKAGAKPFHAAIACGEPHSFLRYHHSFCLSGDVVRPQNRHSRCSPAEARAALDANPTPIITLDNGTFVGAATTPDTQSFLGIPFAQPPVGDLRFRLPTKVDPYIGTRNVTAMGPACSQQTAVVPILSGVVQKIIGDLFDDRYSNEYPSAENCLTLNIIKPANATADSKLPVVLWLFAGGFEFGTPARCHGLTKNKVTMAFPLSNDPSMEQPIIYISINYRVSAFGFLGGREVRKVGVGNLGLHDQREALRWVQKYIPAFGSDPTKVTMYDPFCAWIGEYSDTRPYSWSESAGAISVALQMLTNGGDTEGLFRAGVFRLPRYSCLRTVPYDKLKAAQDASPFFSSYIRTDAEFSDYIASVWAPTGGKVTVDALSAAYSSDLSEGSPFGTGIFQALSPQFKRLASFQISFLGFFSSYRKIDSCVLYRVTPCSTPRGDASKMRCRANKTSGYLNKRYKAVPFLGSFHTTDIFNVHKGGELTDYLINFVNSLDRNGKTVPTWPGYTTEAPNLMMFFDGIGEAPTQVPKTRSRWM